MTEQLSCGDLEAAASRAVAELQGGADELWRCDCASLCRLLCTSSPPNECRAASAPSAQPLNPMGAAPRSLQLPLVWRGDGTVGARAQRRHTSRILSPYATLRTAALPPLQRQTQSEKMRVRHCNRLKNFQEKSHLNNRNSTMKSTSSIKMISNYRLRLNLWDSLI